MDNAHEPTNSGGFEIPTDLTQLTDDELSASLDAATDEFRKTYAASRVDTEHLERANKLAAAVKDIRAEQAERRAEAERVASELDKLAIEVNGPDTTAPASSDASAPAAGTGTAPAEIEPAPPEPAAAPDAPSPAAAEPTPATAAAAPRRPALDLSAVRRRQPLVLPETPAPTTVITAAVDVPGHSPGQPLDFDGVTNGIINRANALKTAGGGLGQVISYRHPFERDLIVTDSSSAPEGSTVTLHAASQRRLPKGELMASGGWCAPSETVYDLTDMACPDMLWDLPEIQLARGGLRYFKTPSLDVAAMTFVHTEADDISGSEKPCFQIPCPDPIEVRCDAVGVCLTAGILTQRHFPELVSWYLRNAMVAHELRVRQHLFEQAMALATPVTLPETFGALSAIYAAVAQQAADMIERHSLCQTTALEVVFPWWAQNLFLADIARQNGQNVCTIDPACIQNVFASLGVKVQFARALSPAVPTNIGGPNPATGWPTEITFLIYPSGTLQLGRGAEVNLGVIHDSNKFKVNDFTALFTEECIALVDRSPDTRAVTVPVCPSGATGAQTELACPAA